MKLNEKKPAAIQQGEELIPKKSEFKEQRGIA